MSTGIKVAVINQIKEYAQQQAYEKALELIRQQDLSQSFNSQFVRICGEVFLYTKNYEECRETLMMAHRIAPEANRVIYDMIQLYAETGEQALLEQYYEQYLFNVTEHDTEKEWLQYLVARARRASAQELYETIEPLHTQDRSDRVAYEFLRVFQLMDDTQRFEEEYQYLMEGFRDSEYKKKARLLKDKKNAAEELYQYPEQSTLKHDAKVDAEEARLLEQDYFRMHPKEPEIVLMADDYAAQEDQTIAFKLWNRKRREKAELKAQAKAQKRAAKKEKKAEEAAEQVKAEETVKDAEDTGNQVQAVAEPEDIAEPKEPVVTEAAEEPEEPEEEAVVAETVEEPEEEAVVAEAAEEPEEAVVAETAEEPEEEAVVAETAEEPEEDVVVTEAAEEPEEEAVVAEAAEEPEEEAVVAEAAEEPEEEAVVTEAAEEPEEEAVVMEAVEEPGEEIDAAFTLHEEEKMETQQLSVVDSIVDEYDALMRREEDRLAQQLEMEERLLKEAESLLASVQSGVDDWNSQEVNRLFEAFDMEYKDVTEKTRKARLAETQAVQKALEDLTSDMQNEEISASEEPVQDSKSEQETPATGMTTSSFEDSFVSLSVEKAVEQTDETEGTDTGVQPMLQEEQNVQSETVDIKSPEHKPQSLHRDLREHTKSMLTLDARKKEILQQLKERR